MGCAKRLVRPRPVRGVSLTQVPFARTATFFAGGGGAMSSEPMFYVNKKKGRRRTVAAAVASEAAAFSSGAATSSSADTSHPARDQERNTGRRGLEPRRRGCLHLERVYGVEKAAVSDNHALATSRPPRARSSALRARPRSWAVRRLLSSRPGPGLRTVGLGPWGWG